MGRENSSFAIASAISERMELAQFEYEIRESLRNIPYVDSIVIQPRTEISLQGTVGLRKDYKLTVFYNQAFFVMSFSVIFKDHRIWAIDRDNRVGWHEHPLENPDLHNPIAPHTIAEIINRFDQICSQYLGLRDN